MSNKKIVAVVGVAAFVLLGSGVAWLKAAPAAVAAPTVGATSATPSYIVVKTLTPVLFTARIDDPSVIATGVNLLKTDASGKTPKVVGVMKDDGTSGDAVKGDKIFTLRVSVNEPIVGSTNYRVSVPFKGVLQRVLTPLLQVVVDPFKLPPDPGETGKTTLEGIDSDRDSVRDDVQRWIGIRFADSQETVSALRQLARAQQDLLVNANAPSGPDADASQAGAIYCLNFVRRTASADRATAAHDAYDLLQDLKRVVLNTKARFAAYNEANKKLSGSSGALPDSSTWSTYCK